MSEIGISLKTAMKFLASKTDARWVRVTQIVQED